MRLRGWTARWKGGFTREVVSHLLFLTGRLAGTFTLQERFAAFPEAGKSERAIRARLTAGGLPVTLVGSVGTTGKDDHNTWTLQAVPARSGCATGPRRNGWWTGRGRRMGIRSRMR